VSDEGNAAWNDAVFKAGNIYKKYIKIEPDTRELLQNMVYTSMYSMYDISGDYAEQCRSNTEASANFDFFEIERRINKHKKM
jgi:hypothetical protein